MQQAFQPAPKPIYKAEKPVRSDPYKRFIKRFPCIFCSGTRNVDPMHTGAHGLGSKSSDMNCLPGCRECHILFDADPKGFAERRDLDIPLLIEFFNHLWELKQRRTA